MKGKVSGRNNELEYLNEEYRTEEKQGGQALIRVAPVLRFDIYSTMPAQESPNPGNADLRRLTVNEPVPRKALLPPGRAQSKLFRFRHDTG